VIAAAIAWALQLSPALAPLADLRAGRATVFGTSATDSANPNDTLACRYPRRLQPGDLGVASYALPCGSRVLLLHGGRAIVVEVIDRGPRRTRGNALQATDLDITDATAHAIGFAGGALTWAPLFEVTK
jgi:hypothetical protein